MKRRVGGGGRVAVVVVVPALPVALPADVTRSSASPPLPGGPDGSGSAWWGSELGPAPASSPAAGEAARLSCISVPSPPPAPTEVAARGARADPALSALAGQCGATLAALMGLPREGERADGSEGADADADASAGCGACRYAATRPAMNWTIS